MKIYNYFLYCTILAIISFNSCSQSEETEPEVKNKTQELANLILPDSVMFEIDNGTLVFESEKQLQTCINYLNAIGDGSFDSFEKTIGYQSFRSVNQDTSIVIEDDILSTLMDPKRQIIVGGYLITTNIKEETNTVKPIDNSGLKASIKEETLDWNINVFDYLETGNRAFLKRSYCGNTDKKKEWGFGLENMLGNNADRIQAKVCFQRAGWYNSIIIKFKYEHSQGDNVNGNVFKLFYKTQNAWYRRRNRKTTHFSRENSTKAWDQGDEISHRPYNGTRRVSAAEVPVYFEYQHYFGNFDDENFLGKGDVLLTMKCT